MKMRRKEILIQIKRVNLKMKNSKKEPQDNF